MFDVTATSNHWVLNPGRNLGLQLALEGTDGERRRLIAPIWGLGVSQCSGLLSPRGRQDATCCGRVVVGRG